jgi:hypothetical protein
MIVWGGGSDTLKNTGAFYDPAADEWTPTPTLDAPSPRFYHTAVWTGSQMIVWGGSNLSARLSGGRYTLRTPTDFDKDGFSVCSGDCDDGNPAINPGAAELCDGMDQNCDGVPDDDDGSLCDDSNGCTVDSCGGVTGCSHSNVADGVLCTDLNECTLDDTCLAGQCVGPAVFCGTPLPCHQASSCDPASGWCSSSYPLNNGTPCDDSDPCTTGDACMTGVCEGTLVPVEFTLTADPSTINSRNHKMVDVVVTPHLIASCGGTPSIVLISVTSSDPDDIPGPSDGNTINDIQGVALGTADFEFQVRAESTPNLPRLYIATYKAIFASGREVTADVAVVVSPNKFRRIYPTDHTGPKKKPTPRE